MTKPIFINAIEAIRIQMANDKAYSYVLGELLKSDVQLYDNSKLIKSIIELLHLSFPRDEDGFSELEHYIFETDFGKQCDEFVSSEDLWDLLISKHLTWYDRQIKEVSERNLMFNPSAGVNINERGHIDLTNPKTS